MTFTRAMYHASHVAFRRVALTGAFLSLMSLPALAGPPYVTDDPEPTDYRSYEIYLASDYARSPDGVNLTVPHLEFNYGLFPNVQVTATLPLAGSAAAHGPMYFGYGDTEFEFKARLVQETDHFPQISIAPGIAIPTGDASKSLGGGFDRTVYPIWAEKGFGKYTVFGGGGITRNPGAGNKDFGFSGLAVTRDMGHGVTLGTEVFGQAADTVGGSSSVGFNVGATKQTDEHHEILFSAGRAIHGTNTFSAYAAFGWMLGPRDKADGDAKAVGDKHGPADKACAADAANPSGKSTAGDALAKTTAAPKPGPGADASEKGAPGNALDRATATPKPATSADASTACDAGT